VVFHLLFNRVITKVEETNLAYCKAPTFEGQELRKSTKPEDR
jgi:hypothetical protein